MLFDFRCGQCKALEEHWVTSSTTQVRCKKCGGAANRVISGTMTSLDPISGDFPGATLKWARHHEQAAKKQS
jgi:putative FmdB family regulatory protein